MRRKIIRFGIIIILGFSLIMNVSLLHSSGKLNFDSLKWTIKSQFIKIKESKNGKINLISNTKNEIEYSKFLSKDQDPAEKELISKIGTNFSIFGLGQGTGFQGLPKGLSKPDAKCATKLGLDSNLYFVDQGKYRGANALVFYQSDLPNNTLVGSLFVENACKVVGQYKIQKSVMSWVLSEKNISNLSTEETPAHFVLVGESNPLIVTRLGQICTSAVAENQHLSLMCKPLGIDFSGSRAHTHIGVKSILIDENKLYVAYAINNKNCDRLEIRKFLLSKNSSPIAVGTLLYRSPKCFNPTTTELNAIGGRMIFSNEAKSEIIFSLGNAEIWTGLESIESRNFYGNILKLDLKTKSTTIISSGHRNPQGLCLQQGILYESEQGPDGGDEFNSIQAGGNYGWPAESYGMPYGEFVTNKAKGRTFGSHSKYMKPLISWVPAIAAGDLICANNRIDGSWSANFLIATLKDTSIRRLVLDGGAVRVDERIPVGSRVRDIVVDKSGRLNALTDDGSIIKFKLINR